MPTIFIDGDGELFPLFTFHQNSNDVGLFEKKASVTDSKIAEFRRAKAAFYSAQRELKALYESGVDAP